MPEANLTSTADNIDTGNDSIVIVRNLETIPGGRTLDVTGFTPDVIPAGHLIIEETATGVHKPMPISGSAYGSLPSGHTYKGVSVASILKSKPLAGIMVRGSVNTVAQKYAIASVLAAAKAALPLIRFTQD